jgi:hypothetical protein
MRCALSGGAGFAISTAGVSSLGGATLS